MSRLALGRLRLRRKMGLGANNLDQGVGVWILITGFWRDIGLWDDNAVWRD